ncbi:MAG: hypothetical protein COA78_06160 [Blastopirellula sp.]|nr:MAG: hypothetical protein COA78_06160 [Blastopirellula sp.]
MYTSNYAINGVPETSIELPSPDKKCLPSRSLHPNQISRLNSQGCSSTNWSRVRINSGCDLSRINNVSFLGDVTIGLNQCEVELPGGLRHPTGIWNATLQNCILGDEVLIRNVRQGISNYTIEDNVVISDLGRLVVDEISTFGNGQYVSVLIEDGTLPITIYDLLSSQVAYILTTTLEDEEGRENIQRLIQKYVDDVRNIKGHIGEGAVIVGCDNLSNLRIGPAARIIGARRVRDASLNSTIESPVEIGDGVILESSIVSSGSRVDSAAIVSRCFLGQGVRIEKQFSATDCLFFANSEMYHGEACSVLAGPYSVSHHKSTLLIASQTSFFNAGAGTNECNHSYKTGPVHYGVLDRGCKTGGSSSLVWPINVGAFTTILGNHRGRFDSRAFPYSYIVEENDKTRLIPAVNLLKIGLWRDQQKWINRDRRALSGRLDLLHYQTLSPLFIERLIKAREHLRVLLDEKKDESNSINISGVWIKQKDAQRGMEIYDRVIRYYLSEHIVKFLEANLSSGNSIDITENSSKSNSDNWLDVGGCFATNIRIDNLFSDLATEKILDIYALQKAMGQIWMSYRADESKWAIQTWIREFMKHSDEISSTDFIAAVQEWREQGEFIARSMINDGLEDLTLAAQWDTNRRVLRERKPRIGISEPRSESVSSLQAAIDTIESRTDSLLKLLLIEDTK